MATSEIQDDIKELQAFLDQASTTRVKDLLTIHIRKWQAELVQLQKAETKRAEAEEEGGKNKDTQSEPQAQNKPAATATCSTKCYTKDIRNYAWDQSDKFMKLYVDIAGVHKFPPENVTATYTNHSVKLVAVGVENINYQIHVAPLFSVIVPSASKFKVKTDKVVIMLKKAKEGETWAYVKEKEGKKKSIPKVDDDKDPNASMMNMLKQMYDDGDDDMKRTLAKAWTQSQDKKATGMDSMVDM